MRDPIFDGFLDRQRQEGQALAEASDILQLRFLDPQHIVAQLRSMVMLRAGTNIVAERGPVEVGIFFASEYLRRAEPMQVVTWFAPLNIFHPNIRPPFLCLGRIVPGTSLVDILYQVHEIITWQKVTMREDDALNHEACAWARRNRQRYPLERRPLKRRAVAFQVTVREGEGA